MTILHFACIENDPCSGVCVAVPQHVLAQRKYTEVGFINIAGTRIDSLKNAYIEMDGGQVPLQMPFHKPFDIGMLPGKFSKPDLVVFHECYRIEYISIARSLRKNHIPYVILPHGELAAVAQRKKHLKKALANLLIFNDFIDHALAVQCLSPQERDNTHFGKVRFIGTNGISIPTQKKESFAGDGIRFLFIGRLEVDIKGLDLMIRAMGMAADTLRKYRCTVGIYGPGSDEQLARIGQLIAENDVKDIVSVKQAILGDAKRNRLLASDVFIQTSRTEGMPMGILEAMSYGLPCLVTGGTTLGDVITSNDAGWCAETSAESIAEALCRACAEKDRLQTLSENAVSAVRAAFSWERVAEETIGHYRQLLGDKL